MDCPSSLAEFFCHPINCVINELANPFALHVAYTLSNWTRSSFSWISSSVFEGVKKVQGQPNSNFSLPRRLCLKAKTETREDTAQRNSTNISVAVASGPLGIAKLSADGKLTAKQVGIA